MKHRPMQQFTFHPDPHDLQDLKKRLEQVRLPNEHVGDWNQGIPISFLTTLMDRWKTQYDIDALVGKINSFPNYLREIQGFKIHFIHIESKNEKARPLMLLHGWPGSILEMLNLATYLVDNKEFSFNLVIPSLVGFAFSSPLYGNTCETEQMANIFIELMHGLGYSRFGVHGGDYGAGIASFMAKNQPDKILGIHLNYIPSYYEPILSENNRLSPAESKFIEDSNRWYDLNGAYAHIQKTRPMTLAYALSDSPVGLCAWIAEKMYTWSDESNQNLDSHLVGHILDNITLYWLTNSIYSSIRLYKSNSNTKLKVFKEDKINVPVGIAHFRYEAPFPPRTYIERGYNIVHWSSFDKGGHFPAIEFPELLSKDIIDFFAALPNV